MTGRVLLIRADADDSMGVGHIMRCLALAQGWQDAGGRVVFLSRLPRILADRLASEGMELLPAATICPDPSDLIRTLKVAETLKRLEDVWLVLDGYHFTAAYQQALQQARLRTLVLDDYGHLQSYHATCLLNQNPWANAAEYTSRINADCSVLAGLDFVLLRREFSAVARQKLSTERHRPLRILVTMGGADPANVTRLVVKALVAAELSNLICTVIAGPAYSQLQTLEAYFATTNLTGEVLANVSDMTACITRSDLAITAGGSTCWELAYLGLPMLVLPLTKNQTRISRVLTTAGAAIDLGWFEDTPTARINLADYIVTKLTFLLPNVAVRAAMTMAGMRLIDNHGVNRVLAMLLKSDST